MSQLILELVGADNLPNIGLDRPPSAYIGFTHSWKFHATDIKEGTRNPRWNNTFVLEFSDEHLDCVLQMTVYNSNKTDVDEILGRCSVSYAELATNKPTVTEVALNNRVSRVHIKHFLQSQKAIPQKVLTASSGIHLRLIDVIEDVLETGELSVEYGSQLQRIQKGSSSTSLNCVRFSYVSEYNQLSLNYQTYREGTKPESYESRVIDLANLSTSESNFLQLAFSNHDLTKKKVLVLCLTCIDNAFSSAGYDSIVVELNMKTAKKDYFMRVVSSLSEDVLNERKLVSRKLNCQTDDTLFLQYFEKRGFKEFNRELPNTRPDAEYFVPLSTLKWQDKSNHLISTYKLVEVDDGLRQNPLDLELKLVLMKGDVKESDQFQQAAPKNPSLKKPLKLNISRLSIGNCYLYEVLQKSQLCWMVKDSEGTLGFTHVIQGKDYSWEVSLPLVMSTRNKYTLELTLFDRVTDFGEKLLSSFENSQVLRATFQLADLNNIFGVLQSRSIDYTEQFRKYAKKVSLTQPQSTKSFSNMVDQKSAVIKLEYANLQSYQYSEACVTLLNAKVSSAEPNSRRSLTIALDGTSINFAARPPNGYLLQQPHQIPVNRLQGHAHISVYDERNNSSQPLLSLYKSVFDLIPINPGKRSKLQLRLPNTDDCLTLFYAVDSEKQTMLTRPQATVGGRIALSEALYFNVRLLEVSVDLPVCETFYIDCETSLKRYRSRSYELQTSRVKLHHLEQFHLGFIPSENTQPQIMFATLNIRSKGNHEQYNGFIELSQLYFNGEEVYCTVPLSKATSKNQSRTYLTVGILPYTCSILKQLSLNSTVALNLDLRYAVELTRLPEGVLRQTASYLLCITFDKKQHYFPTAMQTERISDIGPTCLDYGLPQKQYLNNINDRRYIASLKVARQLTIEIDSSHQYGLIHFELLSANRSTFESRQSTIDPSIISKYFQKVAEGSKPLLEVIQETRRSQFQTANLALCLPSQYALRFSKQGILNHQIATAIVVVYQPKIAGEPTKAPQFAKERKSVPAELLTKAVYEVAVTGVTNLNREGAAIENELIVEGNTTLKQNYDLSVTAIVPRCFFLRPKLNPSPSVDVALKKIVRQAMSNQLIQRQSMFTFDVAKLTLKFNQHFSQLALLKNRGLPTDEVKLGFQLLSNRFSDNPEGKLTLSQVSLNGKAQGNQFDIEIRLVDANACGVIVVDGRNYLSDASKASSIVASKSIDSLFNSNVYGKEVICQTHTATECLQVVMYAESKKIIVSSAVIQVCKLEMEKLTEEEFLWSKTVQVGAANKAVLTVRGNYKSTLMETKKKLAESNIMEKPVEVKYRQGLNKQLLVRLPKPFPSMIRPSQQLASGNSAIGRQFTRISIQPGQFVEFNSLMLNVQMFLVGAKKHQVDPSTYRVTCQSGKSTRLVIESQCVLVLTEQQIGQVVLEYVDAQGKSQTVVARLLEQTKPQQTSQYVFDRTYQMLTTTQKKFASRGVPKSALIIVQLHKVIKRPKDSSQSVMLEGNQNTLINLEGSKESSILTDKFRVVVSNNGQYESSQVMDNTGSFLHTTSHSFGYSEDDITVKFDLVLDNCFNRVEKLSALFQEDSWMKQMILNRGRLSIGEAVASENRNFCLELSPFLLAGEGIASAFSRLLEKNNLYLLGSIDIVSARWGFLSVNSLSLTNLQLKDDTKGIISLRLSIIRQQDRNKEVIKEFNTNYLPIRQSLNFSDSFVERLLIEEATELYNLHIAVVVHYSSQSVVICEKRYNLTDILGIPNESKEEVRLQIKPEQTLHLKAISELKFTVVKTLSDPQNSSTKRPLPSSNKIDLVDFRSKKDNQLIEILLMSHRRSQLLTTLDEIKESFIFTDGEREELSNVLMLFMKVYREEEVAQRITQCLEIYLVKRPEFIAILDKINFYDRLKGMFLPFKGLLRSINQGDLKGIIMTKDWTALEDYIRSNQLNDNEKPVGSLGRLLEVMLAFLLTMLNKSKQLVGSLRADIDFWYDLIQQQATIKSRGLFKDILRSVFTDYSQPTDKQTAKLFEFFILGKYEGCECYLYNLHLKLRHDQISWGQYCEYLLSMVQRKQPWSLDAATALELFYEDITEADLEKFKVSTIEIVSPEVIRQLKRAVDDPSEHLNMLLKKLITVLTILLDKLKPEPFSKPALLAFLKEREKTVKADRKLLLTQFSKKLAGEQSLRTSRAHQKKNPVENRFLISKLDY